MKSIPQSAICLNVRLLLFTAILLVSGCDQQEGQQAQAFVPPAPPVTVAQPLVQTVTDWDEFIGRLYAVESVEVRPRVSGYLQEIHFNEGSIVNKGDLLYVIDPRPYQAELNQVYADVTRAKAVVELAEIRLARAEKLSKTGAISEEEVDLRSNEKRVALASLSAAQAAVKSVELNVEFTHIKAPITGRIGNTLVTEGNLVTGGEFDSTLLATIVSLDPIYVYFSADEQSVLHYTRMDMAGTRKSSRVKPNPVYLRLADEKEYMHKGHMDFVDNRIDMSTGTMRARAIVENPDQLLVPGMFADVKLLGEGPHEAILIPDSVITMDQTIRFVYVVDENNVVSRKQIEPGRLYQHLREIKSGLDSTDNVIIDGIQRVHAGIEVVPETGEITPLDSSEGLTQ